MNKKGFTLAEILGVLVIIGLLLIIIGPLITARIKNNRNNVEETGYKLVYNAVEQLIHENENKYPKGKSYCIKIKELINQGKLVSPVVNIVTGKNIEDKSVLVRRSLSGYISYTIEDNGECNNNSEVDPIEFEIPQECTNIANIKITYPSQIGTNYRHTDNDGLYKEDTITEENRIATENFTKNGTITAEFEYEGKKIQESREVNNIDNEQPVVSLTSNSNSNWIKGANINVTITDEGCGLKENQIIQYGWSNSSESEPTSWTVQNINNSKGSKLENITINSPSVTGSYYLYIKGGILDIAGNTSTPFKFGPFKLDNNAPDCEWTGESTTWTKNNRTITLEIKDNESGVKGTNKKTWKIDSGTTATKKLSYQASDNVGNKVLCEKTVNIYVDKTTPTCGSWTQNSTWTKKDVTIKVGCKDTGSGCTATSYNVKSYTSGTTKTANLSYTIKDNAGNTKKCTKENVKVYHDKTAPKMSAISHSGTSNKISATCSDTGSGVVKSSVSATASGNKTQTLTLTCKDNVGNKTTGSKKLTYDSCIKRGTTCVKSHNGTCKTYGSYICTSYGQKCTGGEEYDCSNCYESKVAKPGCTISSCNSGKNGDTSCRYRCCTTKKCKTEVKCTSVCKSGYYPCTSYNKICDEYNCIGGYK